MSSYIQKLAIVLSVTFAVSACNWSGDKEPTPNTAPEALSDSVSTSTDTVLMGQLAGSDGEGDELVFSLAAEPVNGSVTVAADGAYTYTPNAEFVGDDSFSFSVSDGELSDEGTISINVEVLQVSFRDSVRDAYSQSAQATPLAVNGRNYEQDVMNTAEFDDLVAAGEVSGND
ncbi:hypothetical protein SAMN06297229_0066 [Pseudidiomarina planktonica]|uniref:VCBS repeat-containing protein n=1 Tax=Pseudidiomarina planktonica TaxID=1323738 RepID=A0A1Y6EA88_9GAMM|nr:Ig-like domain-containing protein [Pseudidiomarina planktonica]RUO66424.1 hypothetical protein CWI77_08395 [Pseudidiomarina planktonica]SMQ58141.1 hypothetical protein SAMN06297229_0066 [Pseudidiomarina planktonica]